MTEEDEAALQVLQRAADRQRERDEQLAAERQAATECEACYNESRGAFILRIESIEAYVETCFTCSRKLRSAVYLDEHFTQPLKDVLSVNIQRHGIPTIEAAKMVATAMPNDITVEAEFNFEEMLDKAGDMWILARRGLYQALMSWCAEQKQKASKP